MAKNWYIVHAYSNFEKKVAESIQERAEIENLDGAFDEIIVPTEEVVELRRGRKVNREKRFFPGYVLVNMELTDETFHLVKNTPKVTGFLGSEHGTKPHPVSQEEIDRIINPVITNSSYGSFRFSIANDWMKRNDEEKEIVNLKSNIVKNFHNEIFINPLGEQEITEIKEEFSEEEINEIFRPLAKIKSNNSGYSIGVYDTDSFSKKYIPKIVNKQKKELLTTKTLSQEDIGELVTTIAHKRVSEKGKVSKKTIRSEEFKKYETTFKLKEIVPKDKPSVLLSEEILIDMLFDSNIGFTFSFDDFKISYTDIEYQKALDGFNNSFYSKIISLIKKTDLNTEENDDLKIISRYIGNLDALN